MKLCIPEKVKIVEALCPQVQGTLTGDYISCKNAHKVWIVVHATQAAANTIPITVEQATNVSAGSSKAITVAANIWANEDCVTSDLLVKQTSAVGFTTSAATKHKLVIIQVDPATLDSANGFDCLTVKIASGSASNIVAAQYWLDYRYGGPVAGMPSAIVD